MPGKQLIGAICTFFLIAGAAIFLIAAVAVAGQNRGPGKPRPAPDRPRPVPERPQPAPERPKPVEQSPIVETPADPNPQGVQAAKGFWAAIEQADTGTMRNFYAEKVLLMAGSELLKKEWGIPGAGDRGKDLVVDQDDLIAGYQRLVAKVGREDWGKLFSAVDPEKISVSAAPGPNRPVAGVLEGDLILEVAVGKGDDTLLFVLRSSSRQAHWLVVGERTDY